MIYKAGFIVYAKTKLDKSYLLTEPILLTQ